MKLLHRLTDTLLLVVVTPTAANSRLADYQIIQIIQLVILIVWLQTLPAFTQKHTGHGPRELGATTYSSSLVTPQHHGTLPSILISVAVPLNHHFSGYAKLFKIQCLCCIRVLRKLAMCSELFDDTMDELKT